MSRAGGTFVLAIALWMWAGASRVSGQEAEVSQACVSAYERAGEQREIFKNSLRARVESEKCVALCPAELAASCKVWLTEESAKIARVELTSLPVALARIALRVDGEPRAEMTLELNPGKHEIHASADGFAPLSATVELAPGETRKLSLALQPIVEPPKPKPQADAAAQAPVAGIVVGSVGLASLTAAGALAIVGHVRASNLRRSCAPLCTDEQVAVVEREWIAGGIAGGVGLAALTTGIVLLFAPASDPAVPAVAIFEDGAALSISFRF